MVHFCINGIWIIIVVIIVVIDMGCWNSRMFSIFRRLPVSISGGKKFHKFWISWLPVCRQSHEFNWKFDVLIVMFSMSNIPNAFRLWIFFLTKNIIIDWTRNGLEFNWSKVFQIPLFAQIVFQFILIKCPKWPLEVICWISSNFSLEQMFSLNNVLSCLD